jgi:DNA repair exonuclease SbcCD ATPase subunit
MISALRMVNVRSYANATWQPEPGVNVVIAPNDAGKTTLRAAIEFALAGRAYGFTDERGAGAESLIRTGEKEAVVEVVVVNPDGKPFGVRRTIHASSTPTKVEVQGVAGGTEMQVKVLAERLGAEPDIASLALNSGRFLDRAPAEQQAIILRLAGAEWTAAEIAAAMQSDRSRRALAAIGCDSLAGGADALATIEKRAREARPVAKRDRDALAAEIKAAPQFRVLSAEALAAAEARVAEMQAERDQLQREAGAAWQRSSAAKSLAGRRQRLEAELDALEDKIRGYQAGPSVADAEKAAAKAEAAAQDAAKRAARASEALAVATSDAANWEAALEAIAQGEDGSCPFCPEITCGIQVQAARAVLTEGLDGARRRVAERATALAAAEDRHQRTNGAAEDARLAHVAAEARRDALASALKAKASKEKALAEVSAEQQAAPGRAEDEAAVQDRIAQLDRHLEAERDLLRGHQRGTELEERLATLRRKAEAAESLVRDLEDLCGEFGPSGLRARLLQPILEGFLQDANLELAAGANGAHLRYAADGAIEVESPAWLGGLRAPALSTSMRLRVGIGLQYSICRAAGWRLLVVDGADALDAHNRNAVVGMLQDIAGEGRQVILLAAQPQAELPSDPGIEGLAMWTITDGQFVRLPRASRGVA